MMFVCSVLGFLKFLFLCHHFCSAPQDKKLLVLTCIQPGHRPVGGGDEAAGAPRGVAVLLVLVAKLIASATNHRGGMWLEDAQVPRGQTEVSAAGPHHTLRPPTAATHTYNGHPARCMVNICVPDRRNPLMPHSTERIKTSLHFNLTFLYFLPSS